MITLRIISLLVVLIVVAVALYGLTIFMLARTLTRPRRLTPARALARVGRMSPSDLSLPFEECKFEVTDQHSGRSLRTKGKNLPRTSAKPQAAPTLALPSSTLLTAGRSNRGGDQRFFPLSLSLAAWWMPLPTSSACAILLHGYADAKIGSIAWAPLLQRLGFNVLAVDLRAHGESDGIDTTAGYFERHDISQLIDQLKLQRPGQTESIILFGISMGAAVAAATANVRNDLAAIILDSPYAHFRDAARLHADLTGLPGESFLALGWRIAKWRTGANLEEVDPARTIPTAKCPVLLIAATRDLLVSPEAQTCLQSAITSRGDCSRFWAMEADHVLGYSVDPAEYELRIRQFLDDAAERSGV